MHKYGKVQLMQLQKEWINEKFNDTQIGKNDKNKSLNIKLDNLFRRTVGVTLAQLSTEDRYAQAYIKEGIK